MVYSNHNSRLSTIILVLISFSLLAAQDDISIAVMDLDGRGISALEAQTLTDRLRSQLVRTGFVTVVERGQMQTILNEQDFQAAGCTSDECAVEVGQLLNVSIMVAGSIGKLGSTYTIDLRTIDVGTGQITESIIRDYRGEIDGLIDEMKFIAEALVIAAVPGASFDDEPQQAQPQPAVTPPVVQPQPVQPVPQQPQVKKGGSGLLWLLAIVVAAGGGYLALSGGDDPIIDDGNGNGYTGPLVGTPPDPPGG